MNDYPMLHFVMRHGKLASTCLALALALFGIAGAISSGAWVWAFASVAVAAVGYVLALSYVELVRLIVDMLLPKP
jgi:hypothetical protein